MRAKAQEKTPEAQTTTSRFRIASPAYLCVRPLVAGLDQNRSVDFIRAVPAQLNMKLASGEAQVALLPTIGIERFGRPLVVLPAGCVSAMGRSLTTRIFSRVPTNKLRTLWVDIESRSAVAYAQIIWAHAFHRRLNIIPFDPNLGEPPPDAEAALLVGDRVVARPPLGFDWQIDLGALWYEITGLPIVFGVWVTTEDIACKEIYQILLSARLKGQQELENIAREYGPSYGWPTDLAVRYLTEEMKYEFTDAHREALDEYFAMAEEFGIIDQYKPIRYFKP